MLSYCFAPSRFRRRRGLLKLPICRADAVAELQFSNAAARKAELSGVNERFSGHCDESCEPATDGLGSELFTL